MSFLDERPLPCVAAAYALGIWLGAKLPVEAESYLKDLSLPAAALCAAVALALLARRMRLRLAPPLVAVFLFAGGLAGAWAAHPALPPAGDYTVEARVHGAVKIEESGRLTAYLRDVRLSGGHVLAGAYWTYYPEQAPPLEDGVRVRFTARLYAPAGRTNPYGFDTRMYLLTRGAQAGLSGGEALEILPGRTATVTGLALRVRAALSSVLAQRLGPYAPVACALLLGDTAGMPSEEYAAFRASGIAHVLAVSGLHVGFLAGFLLLLLRPLGLSPWVRLGALCALLTAYCALVGFSASCVRATLLFLLWQGARVVRRKGDRLTLLAAAFLAMLLARPLDLFSASFQLSFAAVAGITLLEHPLARAFGRVIRRRAVCGALSVSLAAQLGVLAPQAALFHSLSLVGLVVSPLVCAGVGALMLAYALALLAGGVPLLGEAVCLAARGMTRALLLLTRAGELPFAQVSLPTPPLPVAAALAVAFFVCSPYCALRPSRRLTAIAVAAAFAAAHTLCALPRDVRYIQLDVGQAESAVILDGRETCVIDTGYAGSDLAAYLLATGRAADHLVLTHLHADHAGALQTLLESGVRVGTLYLPDGADESAAAAAVQNGLALARASGVPVRTLAAGDTLSLARVTLTALWPVAGTARPGGDANERSLALYADLDGVSLLHAAEVPGAYERYIAASADVLKVSHHGAAGETRAPFLDAVSPAVALISCSGRSGVVPADATAARIEQTGARVYRTDRDGAITLRCAPGAFTVTPFLAQPSAKETP